MRMLPPWRRKIAPVLVLVGGGYAVTSMIWNYLNPTGLVRLDMTPELVTAGVTLSFDSRTVTKLRVGSQRVPTDHGENDVLLRCPNLGHAIRLYRHFLTNIHGLLKLDVSCEGNLDEVRCAFLDEGETTRRTTTCSKHDPLHEVW